jgi:hypothetical protein
MLRFRRDPTTVANYLTPGAWMRWTAEFTNGTRIMAVLCCPNGHLGSISSEVHSIAPNGSVTPSYVCPRKGCTFHTFIVLDGWA